MGKKSFKNTEHLIKDIDEKKGIVVLYANAFGNLDTDNDISVKGSFKKTIKENFNRIKHLLNHDTGKLLGIPLELTEDDFGLLIKSQMNIQKQIVKDVFEDYKLFAEHNRTLEHSVRVQDIKRDQGDNRRVLEWKLFEYSTLDGGWGANEKTPLVNIKSLDDLELMIREGNYSDEKSKMIEDLYNKLKDLLKPEEEKEKSEIELLKLFYDNLKF